MKDCDFLVFFVWEMAALVCCLPVWLISSESQIAVASLFIDMTGDIPFHSVALEEGMGAEIGNWRC